MNHSISSTQLPLRHDLRPVYSLSLVAGGVMAAASLAGLLFQSVLYPAAELRRWFVPNDAVNLLIGLPILLGSMALARRQKLIGLLLWPGALLYVAYNSIAYSAAMPFSGQFVFYLALAALCGFCVYRLLVSIDGAVIGRQLNGAAPVRFAAGVLVGFGLLFFTMRVGIVARALQGQAANSPEVATAVADLLTTPLWVAGGVLLWRKQAPGYASGAALLLQASLLFIGLLLFFVLQPFLTGVPFPLEDFIVILAMGLVCFIPSGLFVRAILKRS